MLRRIQTITLALLTALLIILGGFGVFIAEASSFSGIIIEAQSYDPGTQIDAFDFGTDSSPVDLPPGLPY
jgi:hypothetical protein